VPIVRPFGTAVPDLSASPTNGRIQSGSLISYPDLMSNRPPTPERVAAALYDSIGLLARRLRQVRPVSDLSLPESIAVSSLDRNGPATSAELARLENISAQSMHATIAGLTRRGLVERSADPSDGRRVLVSLSAEGAARARAKQAARSDRLLATLAADFTPEERTTLLAAAPLLERLAQAM
jgi:DNA-binding MarR family transcriptional regulator